MAEGNCTVLMALDSDLHLSALHAMLDSSALLELIGTARGLEEAIQWSLELRPESILVAGDFSQEELVDFLRTMHDVVPTTRIVVLRKLIWQRSQIMEAGASAVLSQDTDIRELLSVLTSNKGI